MYLTSVSNILLFSRETEGFLHSKLHGPHFEEHKQEIEQKFGASATKHEKKVENPPKAESSSTTSTSSTTSKIVVEKKVEKKIEKKIENKVEDMVEEDKGSLSDFHAELQGRVFCWAKFFGEFIDKPEVFSKLEIFEQTGNL